MRKMSPALRAELEADPFYQRCCITGVLARFEKVDWHHNFIFAGRQVNEKWCILPLAKEVHDNISKYKEECDRIMLNRATDEELKRYSRAIDLIALKKRLNAKVSIQKG